jgi:NAD-dependent SIR2 family protein deacetylase
MKTTNEGTFKTSSRGINFIEDDKGNIIKKECTKCNTVYKMQDFPKQKNGFGGTESICKNCKRQVTQFKRLVKKLQSKIQEVSIQE